jgi:hypothetical protein
MIHIKCQCTFDITQTGVTGHFRESMIPFNDKQNNQIRSEQEWYKARNQQRNFETLIQLLLLRTQIINITEPKRIGDRWEFEVILEAESAVATFDDVLGILKNDASGVPIILGLEEENLDKSEIVIDGNFQNIWFDVIVINTI